MVYILLYVWVTNTQKRYKTNIYQNIYTYKESLSAVDLKKNVISLGLYKDLGQHDEFWYLLLLWGETLFYYGAVFDKYPQNGALIQLKYLYHQNQKTKPRWHTKKLA